MTTIALSIIVIASLAAAIAMRARRRFAARGATVIADDLAARVRGAAAAMRDAEPWSPSAAPDAPDGAAAIEAALIAGAAPRALETAETAVAARPDAPAPRVWLAWALCANGQPTAALDQLARAGDDPLARYVSARAEHLAFELAAGAAGAIPPLVTAADLAVVTLARGRGAAAWLTGPTERQLSAQQVRAAVGEHREVTARCLARVLDALDAAPGFADAGYLAARLAVKAGAIAAARELFDALASRIVGRPDADAFARDRRDLADPSAAVSAAQRPPAPPTARRARSLRVLP